MGVSPAIRCGIIGGRDLCLPQPEQSSTVNYNYANYKGVQAMVGTGRLGLGQDTDGASGGETDGGVWGGQAGR